MGLLSTIGAASARAYGFTRSAIAAAVDAYFNRVTLLLPGNGTNGAQNNTFLDSSSNNFTITRNGNTTQGTFTPFSQTGWSNYFNGSSYLTAPSNAAFGFGTGDYTVEGWVYSTTRAVANTFFANGTDNCNLYIKVTTGIIGFYTGAANDSTTALPLNQWNHIAVVRSGTNVQVYLNGVSILSITNSTNYAATTFFLGRNGSAGTEYLNGYLSNVRVVKGTAVYTSAFTPSTTALTAITNTQLLTCQDNRFKDNSSNNFSITVNGTPSVQAFSPFAPSAAYSATTNGASGYFDGTGDYLSFPTSQAALLPGSGAFTYEVWCYQTVSTSNATLFSYGNATGNLRFFVGNSTSVTLWNGSTNLVNQSTTNPLNAWQHFVVQRDGSNVVSIYQNGTRIYNATVSSTFNAGTLAIGFDAGGTAWNGYISGFKATIGSAVYSGTTISVPTAPPSPTGSTACVLFTNAGITDATAKNNLETVGNAQISTAQSKFGGSSIAFDGTGDWLNIATNPTITLGSGDFTIEGWVYFNNLSANNVIFDQRPQNTQGIYPTLYVGSSTLIWYTNTTAQITSSSLSTGTWYHFAISKSGSSTKMFINGTQSGSTYTDTNNYLASRTYVGISAFDQTGSLNGYLDDFRITKGYARYTANFTVPTAAFPLQ